MIFDILRGFGMFFSGIHRLLRRLLGPPVWVWYAGGTLALWLIITGQFIRVITNLLVIVVFIGTGWLIMRQLFHRPQKQNRNR